MPPTDPYLTRRRRKERRTRAVAFVLVALFLLGLLGAIWTFISMWLNESQQARELAHIALLPYPDPHPDQTALLQFNDKTYGTRIATKWIPILANRADDGTDTGLLLMRLTTMADTAGRESPTRDILITFAAAGDIRLPADNPMRHPLTLTTGTTSARVWADPYFVGSPSMENAPELHDFMWYNAPTTIIVQAVNAEDLTITIADFVAPIIPEAFEPLRAFTATLKPGYTPPN